MPPPVSLLHFLIVALFLAGLGALWLLVQRGRDGLTGRATRGRRIGVVEVTALSPQDRAMILAVDGREFLVLRIRGSAPVVTPLLTGGQE